MNPKYLLPILILFFSISSITAQIQLSLDYSLDSIYFFNTDGSVNGKNIVLAKNGQGLPLVQQFYYYDVPSQTFTAEGRTQFYDYDQEGNRILRYTQHASPYSDTSYNSPYEVYNQYGELTYRYGSSWSFQDDPENPVRTTTEYIDTTVIFENERPVILHRYVIEDGFRALDKATEYVRGEDGKIDTVKSFDPRFQGTRILSTSIYRYDLVGNLIRVDQYSGTSENNQPGSASISEYDEQNRFISGTRVSYRSGDTLIESINLVTYDELYSSSWFFQYDTNVDTIRNGGKGENFLLGEDVVDSTANFIWDFDLKDWVWAGSAKYYYTTLNSTNNYLSQLEFKLYPNPTNDELWIDFPTPTGKKMNISIFDASGKVVLSFYTKATVGPIDIATLQLDNGIYFLRIDGGSGKAFIVQGN